MNIDRLRADQARRIATNPAKVYWEVNNLVPDGNGGFVEDIEGGHSSETFYVEDVRIAEMSSSISNEAGSEVHFGYAQPLLITAMWNATWMTNGMVVQWNERKYRIDDVKAVTYKGGIISKIAKLTDVTSNGGDTIVVGAVLWLPNEDDVAVIGG